MATRTEENEERRRETRWKSFCATSSFFSFFSFFFHHLFASIHRFPERRSTSTTDFPRRLYCGGALLSEDSISFFLVVESGGNRTEGERQSESFHNNAFTADTCASSSPTESQELAQTNVIFAGSPRQATTRQKNRTSFMDHDICYSSAHQFLEMGLEVNFKRAEWDKAPNETWNRSLWIVRADIDTHEFVFACARYRHHNRAQPSSFFRLDLQKSPARASVQFRSQMRTPKYALGTTNIDQKETQLHVTDEVIIVTSELIFTSSCYCQTFENEIPNDYRGSFNFSCVSPYLLRRRMSYIRRRYTGPLA